MDSVNSADLEQLEADLQVLYEDWPKINNAFFDRMAEAVTSEQLDISKKIHPSIAGAFVDELNLYKVERRIEAKVMAAAEEYVKEMMERLDG
jgi:hypothetical protein